MRKSLDRPSQAPLRYVLLFIGVFAIVTPAWQQTIRAPVPARWVGLAGILVTLASYGWLVVITRRRRLMFGGLAPGSAVALLAAQSLAVALTCIAADSSGLSGTILVAVTAVCVLRPPWRAVVPIALCLADLVLPRIFGWQSEDWLALSLMLASAGVNWFGQVLSASRKLEEAQAEVATLAVGRERERIARDMHDVLGHSLSAISVKAELAGRLVSVDPARAAAELTEVQDLARSALADVRATLSAIRAVSLSGELAGARQMLDAAGIEAHLPTSIDMVSGQRRELFAWALREGVTNIVRHSGATLAEVTLAADRIVVDDDGRGPGAADADSSGLAGLRRRAETLDASVRWGRSPLGGFRLSVQAGPTEPVDQSAARTRMDTHDQTAARR